MTNSYKILENKCIGLGQLFYGIFWYESIDDSIAVLS